MAATMTPSVLRLSILADRHPSLANVASFLLVDSDDSVVTAFADFTELLLRVVPQDTAEFSVAMRKLLEARDAMIRVTG